MLGAFLQKAIIRAARAWAEVNNSSEFGLHISPNSIKRDFDSAMARMRKLRARISHVDSAHRYKKLGVDIFIGEGNIYRTS